jgi:hypothetical protein
MHGVQHNTKQKIPNKALNLLQNGERFVQAKDLDNARNPLGFFVDDITGYTLDDHETYFICRRIVTSANSLDLFTDYAIESLPKLNYMLQTQEQERNQRIDAIFEELHTDNELLDTANRAIQQLKKINGQKISAFNNEFSINLQFLLKKILTKLELRVMELFIEAEQIRDSCSVPGTNRQLICSRHLKEKVVTMERLRKNGIIPTITRIKKMLS